MGERKSCKGSAAFHPSSFQQKASIVIPNTFQEEMVSLPDSLEPCFIDDKAENLHPSMTGTL